MNDILINITTKNNANIYSLILYVISIFAESHISRKVF